MAPSDNAPLIAELIRQRDSAVQDFRILESGLVHLEKQVQLEQSQLLSQIDSLKERLKAAETTRDELQTINNSINGDVNDLVGERYALREKIRELEKHKCPDLGRKKGPKEKEPPSVAEHTKALQDNKVLRETLQTQETRNLKQRDLLHKEINELKARLSYVRDTLIEGLAIDGETSESENDEAQDVNSHTVKPIQQTTDKTVKQRIAQKALLAVEGGNEEKKRQPIKGIDDAGVRAKWSDED